MTHSKTDGHGIERDRTAAEVLLGAIDAPSTGPILVAHDKYDFVGSGLEQGGAEVHRWWRNATLHHGATSWPTGGPYAGAVLRLSKDKEAFDMALHAVASVLAPGAPLWVYGANDEGIKSANKRMAILLGPVTTIDTRRHCRVLEVRRPSDAPGLRPALGDWTRKATLEHPTGEVEQTSYPGLFAKGGLDPATAMLLDAIRTPDPGSVVLDFACGAGVIGNNLLSREPTIQLHLLDSDAVAVEATRENVPQGEVHTGASLTQLPDSIRFDLIVSNPPIHDGKARDYAVVRDLIKHARSRLNRGGALWLVVQRQVPVGNLLEERLAKTRTVHEDGQFKVWRAIAP